MVCYDSIITINILLITTDSLFTLIALGAGKSTLSNILSCETDPSSGEVFIFGNSVVSDVFNIRRLMSICKQDDFLWPDLTAKEHLDIFAGLRGVDPSTHNETVLKWLESVDLSDVQHIASTAFSGGMKRRLSVALSTIGNRPFLIFDEPTTGMVSLSLCGIIDDQIPVDAIGTLSNTISFLLIKLIILVHPPSGSSKSTFCMETLG